MTDPRPYIGITDFTSFLQVEEMLEVFNRHVGPNDKRLLHVGVMMSYKTLHGLETKWSRAFPLVEDIASIFASPEPYNCLHYADYDEQVSDAGRWRFRNGLVRAIMASHKWMNLHALQLDVPWPDPVTLESALQVSRAEEVVLQVGRKAMSMEGNDPRAVALRLVAYESLIDRVLLDESGGEGRGMDAKTLLAYIRAIKDRWPDLEEAKIVVAGGLGPDTVHLVEPILREFPGVSMDAQGRLRPSGNALDPIDWNMAGRYLEEALKLTN